MISGGRQLFLANAGRRGIFGGAMLPKQQPQFTPAMRSFHASGIDLAKVLLCDGINPAAAQVFEEAGHSIVERPQTDEAELKKVSLLREL